MSRYFAGSNQYISPGVPIVNNYPFTVSCWFNPDNIYDRCLFSVADTSASNKYAALMPVEELRIVINDGASWIANQTANQYVASTWNHACGVWAATNSRSVILNGGTKSTSTTASIDITADFDDMAIGGLLTSSGLTFDFEASVAEFAIWSVVLSDSEITILALGVSPLLVRPESLICYIPLVRDNDNDLIDGVSFTAYNTPTISDHPPIIYYNKKNIIPLATLAGGINIPVVQHHRQQQGVA